MFKILAGVLLFLIAVYCSKEGDNLTSNISLISAIALIGAGVDTIFHKK